MISKNDLLYKQAIELLLEHNHISVAQMGRTIGIGYTKGSNIMDILEK